MHWKIWCSSLVFILATMVKLLFPSESEAFCSAVIGLVDMDTDYKAIAMEIGSYLTDGPVQEVVNTVEEFKLNVITFQNTETDETEMSSIISERVEAFMHQQEAYSGYAKPENVSYDLMEIPFSFMSPVTAACGSGFGYRIHPIEERVMFHYGTDFDVEEGTEILCFADGFVSAVGTEDGYGNYICVEHSDGWESLYAHCDDVSVTAGQSLHKGEVIGKSGSTGRVTGPHLHFELSCNDVYTNPEFYLP